MWGLRSPHLAISILVFARQVLVQAALHAESRRLLGVDRPLLSSLEVLLSSQRTVLLEWDYSLVTYSLTVPYEAVAASILATVVANASAVEIALYRPDEKNRELLVSGRPSLFSDIPTEEAANFLLEVRDGMRATNFTIAILRSTITSEFGFQFPDPGYSKPPQGTLVGLQVFDQHGTHARMDVFEPRRSQYIAAVGVEIRYVWLIASQNDPDATLSMRVDGQLYSLLPPGVNSPLIQPRSRGWTLVEIRVDSPTLAAQRLAPLVYEVVLIREALCHERCRTCFGPDATDCSSCRAPLVLFEGECVHTDCPPDTFYEWKAFQCRRCHPSCAQCSGPGSDSCSFCPALHFLATGSWNDPTGVCTLSCPAGTFAHPGSRRCRLPPKKFNTFYLRYTFRISPLEYQASPRLQQMVLNTTAFVLGLSLTDVKAFRLEVDNFGVRNFVEIVSPFMTKTNADKVSIDMWFGAFEIPVDDVTSFTWADMHQPLPPLPKDPLIPGWGYGFIASAVIGILVLVPLYCCYFRRLANTKKVYVIRRAVDPIFVDQMVNNAPSWIIRKFVALESGAGKATQ